MQMKARLSIPLGNEGHKVEQKKFPHYQKDDDIEAFLVSFEEIVSRSWHGRHRQNALFAPTNMWKAQ